MVYGARERIRDRVKLTPLIVSERLSELIGGEVFLKLENRQVTGSFKARGALNKVLQLSEDEREKGLVAASAGNHGQGMAWAAQQAGIKVTVVVPQNTPQIKIDAILAHGVELMVEGRDYDEAEAIAKVFSRDHGRVFVSPYNDSDVIAGQGTVGLEIMEQWPQVDTVLVPVGGGGIISGISLAMGEGVDVVGVQSSASPTMHESLRTGHIVDVELGPSIAEGLHGGLEVGAITFDIVNERVRDILLVNEEEIGKAVRSLHLMEGITVEGSAAVGPAAIRRYPGRFTRRKVAVVITGGNIEPELLARLLA